MTSSSFYKIILSWKTIFNECRKYLSISILWFRIVVPESFQKPKVFCIILQSKNSDREQNNLHFNHWINKWTFFFNCRFIRLKEIASFSKELWLISKLNIPSRVYFNLSLRKMHHYENRISLTQLTARFFLQFVESNKYIKYQGMPLWNGARFSKYPAGIVTQETTSKFKCMTNYCNE